MTKKYKCMECREDFDHDKIVEIIDYLQQSGNRRKFKCHECLSKQDKVAVVTVKPLPKRRSK